jgi:hypothetical protein
MKASTHQTPLLADMEMIAYVAFGRNAFVWRQRRMQRLRTPTKHSTESVGKTC